MGWREGKSPQRSGRGVRGDGCWELGSLPKLSQELGSSPEGPGQMEIRPGHSARRPLQHSGGGGRGRLDPGPSDLPEWG